MMAGHIGPILVATIMSRSTRPKSQNSTFGPQKRHQRALPWQSLVLTIFMLISQSRMARQSERRSHLNLQVGMLSEQELTTILLMLQKLCQHMGVKMDSSRQEVQSFSETTDVHKLASELADKLSEE